MQTLSNAPTDMIHNIQKVEEGRRKGAAQECTFVELEMAVHTVTLPMLT